MSSPYITGPSLFARRRKKMSKNQDCTDKELSDLFRAFDPKETGYIDITLFEQLLHAIG